jgi:small conductance mechanosensitive channel
VLPSARPEWLDRVDQLHLLTPARMVIIVLIAWAVSYAVTRLVRRLVRGLRTLADRSPMAPDHARYDQRARTLSSVIRSTMLAVIWTIAAIAILGELDVNLGAFVATATIIGGALAFGAQQIVRDILAGFFMFAEDQYGVGDIVDLGLATGTVERVSLRVTRLRDDAGRVWYVPNGQVQRVANLSQEWAQAVLDVPVARDADLATAAGTIEALAHELRADDRYGPEILEEPQLVGVQDVLDDRVVLRLLIKTRPPAQWSVTRAMRVKLLDAVRSGRLPAPTAVRPILLREDSLRTSFGPTPGSSTTGDGNPPHHRVDPEDAG